LSCEHVLDAVANFASVVVRIRLRFRQRALALAYARDERPWAGPASRRLHRHLSGRWLRRLCGTRSPR
jgi:hypothetical protein